MKRLLLLAAFAIPAHAGACDEETIRDFARGGNIVVLDSGGVYEVEPDDLRTRRFGMPETASFCAATRK